MQKRHFLILISLIVLLLSFFQMLSAGLALLLGLAFGNLLHNPWLVETRKFSAWVLKLAIVFMGFGMGITQLWDNAAQTFVITLLTILIALVFGVLLFRLLKIHPKTGWLISSGTAICGGSAIAAVSQAIRSQPEQTAMAVTIVFLLNTLGLFLFPWLGQLFKLSQEQFGLWAALAIHDTSSVVGAAAAFGDTALEIATITKLSRALWIIPLTFLMAALFHNKGKVSLPLFIFLFVGASIFTTFLPGLNSLFNWLAYCGKSLMTFALFCLGLGVTRDALKSFSLKPALMGVILWIILAVSSLAMIEWLY